MHVTLKFSIRFIVFFREESDQNTSEVGGVAMRRAKNPGGGLRRTEAHLA